MIPSQLIRKTCDRRCTVKFTEERGMGETMIIYHVLLTSNLKINSLPDKLGVEHLLAEDTKTFKHARVLWLLVQTLTLKTNDIPCWITTADTWSTATQEELTHQVWAGHGRKYAWFGSLICCKQIFHFLLIKAVGNFYGSPWGKWNTSSCSAGSAQLLPGLSAWELRLRENKAGSSMRTATWQLCLGVIEEKYWTDVNLQQSD